MQISVRRLTRQASLLAATLLVGSGVAVVTAPAALALDQPSNVRQSASQPTAGAGIPVLEWDRVPGATSYEVKVGATTVTTTNLSYVPTTAQAAGTSPFSVRAKSSGQFSEWTSGTFETLRVRVS